MKYSKQSPISIQAKLVVTALKVIVISFFLFAFTSEKLADEVWKQLGISKKDGNYSISQSFLHGYLYYYGAKNAKNITTGNRVAMVKDLATYAKQYVNSEEFKKEYLQHREYGKPATPKPAKSIDEVRNEQISSLQKSIKDLEGMKKMDNADIRKMAAENIVKLQQQKAAFEDPNNKLIKLLADNEKRMYESSLQTYQEKYKKWEKDFPEDHMVLVKSRLQKFLDLTTDVDYQAELKEQYGKKRFVNPVYEKKPAEWKQAYRAGKEATETARAFAQQWLKESR